MVSLTKRYNRLVNESTNLRKASVFFDLSDEVVFGIR